RTFLSYGAGHYQEGRDERDQDVEAAAPRGRETLQAVRVRQVGGAAAESVRVDCGRARRARDDRGETFLPCREEGADRGHSPRGRRGTPGDQARHRRSAGDGRRRGSIRGEGEGAAGGRRAPRRGRRGRDVSEGGKAVRR